MYYVILFIHVIVCLFLVIVVLLQSGKSADIAGMFGGLGSQTAFGPRGAATILTKATTWSAIIFMVTSLTLSILSANRSTSNSVLRNLPTQTQPKSNTPAQQNPAPANPK